ncbi:hypothetical protein ACIA8G_15480 [Lentzea sp. NPDC051213]|uniref:hypothetical protein n=1 Tax=Lentzea sp. NPDC051213 TaxID=3364126 RepID=UPI003799013C
MNADAASRTGSAGWWPWALTVGAVALFIGGMLHPRKDPALSGHAAEAAWIGDPMWVPSHALVLLSSTLFALGLVGLLRHRPDLPAAARRAGWTAVAGAVLSVIENVPHLAATTESDAAAAGHATPFLSTHMVLALLAFPLFGFSVAALAALSKRHLAHPALGVGAVIGGISWGLAPWVVGPLGLESFNVLFIVGMLMALWFAAVGIGSLIPARRTASGAAQ